MKLKFLFGATLAAFLLIVLAIAVLAQEEPPAPYAGMKNPSPWDDSSAHSAGKGLYQQYCLGCHGVNGGNIAGADFSAADFPPKLEQRQDFYFWTLSEGRLSKGMPLYKSSLSAEQRWQVLSYLWSLNTTSAPPKETPPVAKPPLAEEGSTLLLTAPEQAQTGQPMTLSAVLKNSQGEPIENAEVKFFIKVDFFASGLMEIGDASTDEQGIATLEYTPRITGDNQVIASYDGIETSNTVTVMKAEEALYHPEVGIHLPAPGEEVFIGPESASELEEGGKAPVSAFRLPGGILSWLLLFVAAVMLVWSTYFRVIYQVLRIPIAGEITETDTRLIPRLGLAYVVMVGTLLVLFIITGPYTHFHLFR